MQIAVLGDPTAADKQVVDEMVERDLFSDSPASTEAESAVHASSAANQPTTESGRIRRIRSGHRRKHLAMF